MRPVNLIPVDERRNTSVAGRSGGGVYVLLGGLALLVVLVAAYSLAGRSVTEKRAELSETRAEANQVQAQADRLQAYTTFASLRAKRLETVRTLAGSRFDWSRALREVARTIPAGVSLTGLTGTVTSGVTVDGGGAQDALRGALPNPAIEIVGCAPGQDGVARLMSDLRRIEGVVRVSLSASEKADGAGGGTTAGASATGAAASTAAGDCTGGSAQRPKFSMTVFFAMPAPAAPAAPAAAPAAVSATTSNGGTK